MPAGHRPRQPTSRQRVVRVDGVSARAGRDTVVVEEPMEIRVGTAGAGDADLVPLAVTMRTPGHDFELATGFVVTEGIAAPEAVRAVAYCGLPPDRQEYNVVTVRVAGSVDVDRHRRNVFTTSSCGICGKASIDAVEVACHRRPAAAPVPAAVIATLPDRLRERQALFDATGGLHAAGLFDAAGGTLAVREDVGRHNAVDKLAGWAVQRGLLPLDDTILVVSGRLSFEIVQKAAVVGIGMVVAVSAPSSLAISAGDRLGVTVIAFTRDGRFTVYSAPERVVAAAGGGVTLQPG